MLVMDNPPVVKSAMPAKGIECPDCGCCDLRVVMTRTRQVVGRIRRVRECRHCGKRITTYERVS